METTTKAIEISIIKHMKKSDTYHRAYNSVIKIFADLLYQWMWFKEAGSSHDSTITKEIVSTLKNDLVSYADRLEIDNETIETIINDNEERLKLEAEVKER